MNFICQPASGFLYPQFQNPYYFNTWAVQKPYTTADDLYNYYITSNNSDLVPSGCLRTYIKENGVVTANVKCALPRLGISKPNDLSWATALVYEVEIVATLSPLKVTSAKVKFNDYNQIIDFTSKAQISMTNVNGYDELIIGGGDYVVTTNDNFTLYIKCIFRRGLIENRVRQLDDRSPMSLL